MECFLLERLHPTALFTRFIFDTAPGRDFVGKPPGIDAIHTLRFTARSALFGRRILAHRIIEGAMTCEF